MIFNTMRDIYLKGVEWENCISKLNPNIFDTMYKIFALCSAIGIYKDEQAEIENNEENKNYTRTIPRVMISQNVSELTMLVTSALLTTKHVAYTTDQRIQLALGTQNDIEFNEYEFLLKYANAGMKELNKVISKDDFATIDGIQELLKKLETDEYLIDRDLDFEIFNPDDLLCE